MQKYLLRRLIQLLPTLLGVTILVFSLMHLAPGDPATAILGINATPDKIAYIHKKYGLDKPLPMQYFIWLENVGQGNLGQSIVYNRPVLELILTRFPVTLQLSIFAMIISLIIAFPSGIVSAVRKDSWADNAARVFAFLGASVPDFWLGILLIIIFGVVLGVLPIYGFVNIFKDPVAGFSHIILPAITLGTALTALVTRMIRSSLLEVLNQDYITTARSKGLPERTVIWRHALKNSMIPVVTIVGLQLGYVLGGSVLTEVVFALPGLGRLMVNSIFSRDYPVVQGAVLIYALTFVMVNLVVDLLYSYLDPRIRYD